LIRINGEDLYPNFAALKQDIAVVPQKDVLHDALAVGAALQYTAELRLPPDTSREEIAASVADILEVVGLTNRRGTLLRQLSGGQVKRASLANELIARPSLLFIDEVTSGLDELTDREMMELFRQIADGGKTVVCITHNLANVEATCHLLIILAESGRFSLRRHSGGGANLF
jgi:ABC transport system ATP-binding/permease protein